MFVLSRVNWTLGVATLEWTLLLIHYLTHCIDFYSFIFPFAVQVAKTAQYAHHVPALNHYDYSDYGHYDAGHYDAGHYDAGHYY